MDNELLNRVCIDMELNNYLSNDIKSYIKNLNNFNINKNNIFFMDIIFVYVNKMYDMIQFKRLISNNILALSSTQVDNTIALFIIPVFNENLIDDYINILIKDIKERNFITYYEFLNFKNIPMYLFDEEFLIKYNINIGSNSNILPITNT